MVVCGVGSGLSAPGSRGSDIAGLNEAGSYLRLIASCITQLKAQGPSRTCNESKDEEEEVWTGNIVRVSSCPFFPSFAP